MEKKDPADDLTVQPAFPPWAIKFKNHFNRQIFINENEVQLGKLFRIFAKWWFDVVKNFLVVEALGVAAKQANSWSISFIYNMCWLVFSATFYSYGWGIQYYIWISPKRPRISFWISLVLAAILGTACLIALDASIYHIEQLVALAQHSK